MKEQSREVGQTTGTQQGQRVRARDGQDHNSSQKSGRGLPLGNNADTSNRPYLDLKGLGEPS